MTTQLTLNRQLIEVLRGYLVSGCFGDEAAGAAGVNASTFRRWTSLGYEARGKLDAGEELTESQALYMELADMVRRSRAEAVVYAIGTVKKHMSKNWRAAAWYLAVCDPERYAGWGRREGEMPTPEQVARMAVESGEVHDEDRDALVITLRDVIEQRKRAAAAASNGHASNGHASNGGGPQTAEA